MRKLLIVLLILTAVTLAVTGCVQERGTKFIISFNSNGGSEIDYIVLNAGDPLTLPDPPTREGYVFLGWFNDIECTRPVLLDRFRANSNLTLFAGWQSVETYPHQIIISESAGGSVAMATPEITDQRAPMGTEVKLKVVPDLGFECVSLNVIAASGEIPANGTDNLYVFTMPAEDVTVYAEFDYERKSVTVSESTENGTVLLSQDAARFGDIVSVSFIPDFGYRSVGANVYYLKNGTQVEIPLEDGAFEMPNENVSVQGLFEEIDYSVKYEVSTEAADGGEVKVGKDSAAAGEYVYFYVVPEDGFLLTGVYVSTGGESYITHEGFFVMPEDDVTVSAVFVPDDFVNIDRYELEFADTEGAGSVETVSDKTHFAAGEKVVLNIEPASGYEAQGLVVNGTYFEKIGNEYYFFMPPEKAFISVDFRFTGYPIEISVPENAEVFCEDERGCAGDTVFFSAEADEGYFLTVSAECENGEITVETVGIYEYSFDMPDCAVEIRVDKRLGGEYSVVSEVIGEVVLSVPESATAGDVVEVDYDCPEGYALKTFSVTANGEEVVIFGNEFVMPESEVIVSAEFAPVYYINAYDNEDISITPSAYTVFAGDTVYFDVDVHGYKKQSDSGNGKEINPYSVDFSLTCGNNVITETVVYSGNKTFVVLPDDLPAGQSIYINYLRSGFINNISHSKIQYTSLSAEGTVTSNYRSETSVPVGAEVILEISPAEGYALSELIFKNLFTGETYPGNMLFRMPEYDLQITAEFVSKSADPVTPVEIYAVRKDEFTAAGFEISLSHSAAELSEEWKGYTLSGYLNGAVSVKSDDSFDFYLLYVDSLSTVAPVSQTAGMILQKTFPEAEIDCYIYYNTIVFALDGDAGTGYEMLKYGVEHDENFIYFRRADQTLGVLAYKNDSPYVTIPDSVNGSRVAFIHRLAFGGNTSIRTINFAAVTEIDDFAFEGVTGVKYFDIGFVSDSGVGAFKNTRVRRFDTSTGNGYFTADSYGVLYSINLLGSRVLEAFPTLSDTTVYTLQSRTNAIADYAFYGAENLVTIKYMSTLTTVGDYAFYGAVDLGYVLHSSDNDTSDKKADFSNTVCNVTDVGSYAFAGTDIEIFRFDKIISLGTAAVVFDGTGNVTIVLNGNRLIDAEYEPVLIDAPDGDAGFKLSLDGGALTEEYKNDTAFSYLSEYFND